LFQLAIISSKLIQPSRFQLESETKASWLPADQS
jgi:hypothetical protein